MSTIKVILVDDEKEFVTTLSERIEMRDVKTQIAYSGESAMDLVAENIFDVMVLDLNMPGMDGLETLEKVKAIRPEIRVIILTGHGSEKEKIKSMELGAFAYMQKPVDLDTLMHKIKKAHANGKSE